jgi:mannose-6-phosphate isomerase class I
VTRPVYDRAPFVAIAASADACVSGWDEIGRRLQAALPPGNRRPTVAVECYPGVDETEILEQLRTRLGATLGLGMAEALRPAAQIDDLVAPFLGGGDPVFGFLCPLTLPQFLDAGKCARLRAQIARQTEGLVLVVGAGATHLATADLIVYADLARWEAQLRFRRNETGNWGAANPTAPANLKYKRAFFVDWRVADRWKQPLIARADFWLDTHQRQAPKLADGAAVRAGLHQATTQPFRVVPFFDPAPWGGQWMKTAFALDPTPPNYGWCFDCVPEENSLLLGFGAERFELPAMDLVLEQPQRLLGRAVVERFGAEFPIRFDFLDTMGGGNLSFQVHPLAEYARRHFGISYTQDESYYVLDAAPDATVYLGLRENVSPPALAEALGTAQSGGGSFPVDAFANRWSARPHDHFLIPAGTVHCSGRNTMVLEISATPYIFTFKLWDWDRLGLDGKRRPIHLEHGLANVQWDRSTRWVEQNLINAVQPVAAGDGWREERTGLHPLQFIEVRRHWFTGPVAHDTQGTVNVLNLVAGDCAVVESPEAAFPPFTVHYAETFIVPAAVGRYTIRPAAPTKQPFATLKAYCRLAPAAPDSPPVRTGAHA